MHLQKLEILLAQPREAYGMANGTFEHCSKPQLTKMNRIFSKFLNQIALYKNCVYIFITY